MALRSLGAFLAELASLPDEGWLFVAGGPPWTGAEPAALYLYPEDFPGDEDPPAAAASGLEEWMDVRTLRAMKAKMGAEYTDARLFAAVAEELRVYLEAKKEHQAEAADDSCSP